MQKKVCVSVVVCGSMHEIRHHHTIGSNIWERVRSFVRMTSDDFKKLEHQRRVIYVSVCLEVCLEGEDLGLAGRHAGLLVLADLLLKEVRLALKGDHLHEVEGVLGAEDRLVAEGDQEAVCNELDVLRHQLRVHANQTHGERVADELLLDRHGVADDLADALLTQLVHEVLLVQHARKVGVEALVARDQLVGEGQAGHQTTFLHPKDRAEAAGEKDALHRGERDQALGEGGRRLDPPHGPLRLALDAGDRLDGLEQALLLGGVADVGLDQHAVGLAVDVLHRDLEAVEAAGLGDLDVGHEALGEVLKHDAVAGGEEREDVLDEVTLVVVQCVPVLHVAAQVDLFHRPEGALGILVLLPDVGVVDGEQDEAVRVVAQQRLVVGDDRHIEGGGVALGGVAGARTVGGAFGALDAGTLHGRRGVATRDAGDGLIGVYEGLADGHCGLGTGFLALALGNGGCGVSRHVVGGWCSFTLRGVFCE
jgi:hypothetical protein